MGSIVPLWYVIDGIKRATSNGSLSVVTLSSAENAGSSLLSYHDRQCLCVWLSALLVLFFSHFCVCFFIFWCCCFPDVKKRCVVGFVITLLLETLARLVALVHLLSLWKLLYSKYVGYALFAFCAELASINSLWKIYVATYIIV